MFKTEDEVIHWLYRFTNQKRGRSLDHLEVILNQLGNPHRQLKTIHVAGTNGKGSTVSYAREALMKAGYKTATFTSPYMTCFGERLSIDNMPMRTDQLVHYANLLTDLLPESTDAYTSFDLITLMSFLYFVDEKVDIAIYETGIGGRLDSTNVITPLATGITNVGHDHADVLGATQLARAKEKLGIVKETVPLFTTEEDPTLHVEFKKVCQEKRADLCFALADAKWVAMEKTGVSFDWGSYQGIHIKMHGEHQFKNAVLAVAMLAYLRSTCGFDRIDPTAVTDASWPGRFEHMRYDPPVILDGAHNLEGIEALIKTVETIYPTHKKKFLFSAIGTKDAKKMIALLDEVADELIFTKGRHVDAIDPKTLASYCNGSRYHEDYQVMLHQEMTHLLSHEVLIVCGSLYFISDVRSYLLEK
ncbi:MAG: bifunctional folylpolyglutamate synthase/dihydrofolate synthase [Defluviitaleaceae bacterium]|nr:bifunctional folylpolyglutamate synthase/dihydrofolate synthase [Defluviitaleaceae bacterium]